MRSLGIAALLACAACAQRGPLASTPTPAAATADWLARAQASITAHEYRASENGEGLQAPNRRHDLRTYFEPDGIRVVDRTAAGSPQLLELSLAGVGRGAALHPVLPGTLHAEEARVEIRRPGLVEWYVNGPDGLEQGFTIAEPPAGDGKLVLALRLDGARATRRGGDLVFETATGRKLAYGKLAAFDGRGAPLAAEFALADDRLISVTVDDAGAAYPIVIDPLLAETADTQLESDQANAFFGGTVASAGDVNGDGFADVIVGSPNYDNGEPEEGAAFVFLGSASGVPDAGAASAQAQLESNQDQANMGISVASAGDVNGDGYADVIVGAWQYSAGHSFEGAAFVFLGSPTGIADGNPTTAHARFEGNQTNARLGVSVASAGDVNRDGYADVILGASNYTGGQEFEGAGLVFLGSAIGLANGNPATAHALLEGDQAGSHMGWSVASAGDVNGDGFADVIVGADQYSESGQIQEGAAFVFLGSAAGVADGSPATAHAWLESDQGGAHFGESVASAGDVNGDGFADVIVGASVYDAGETNEGAAFVFLGGASGIADGTPLSAHAQIEGDQPSTFLGSRVGSAGDVNGDGYADVVVSASSGFGLVFLGSAIGIGDGNPSTAFVQLAQIGGAASAGDVNGDGYADVIAGAAGFDGGQPDEGAAFIFHGGATGIADATPASAASRLESNQASAELGNSVASAGDVNGDGYGDVIVGAPLYDEGQTNEGAAFLFHGGAAGIADAIPITANARLESNQEDARLGWSVASAGDVNGDGYADVVVGANQYDAGQTNEGAAFVFLGSASGVANGSPANAHAQLESNQEGGQLGFSVASAGDVDGDGYADVLVGAPFYDDGEIEEGAAFLFRGGPSGLPDGNPGSAHARFLGDDAAGFLGWSVASAGDVNGDGFADVIVGGLQHSGGGAALVFLGGASGIANGAALFGDQVNQGFGGSVASAGDVDGDGYADVLVGAPGYGDGQGNEGAAFVFRGGADGIASGGPINADTRLQADQAGADLGASVASAGDVNGDGYADVIVGASGYDAGETNEGAAFVFLGGASGVADGNPASAYAQLESDQGGALSAGSVASAGDVNGDGFADVLVGGRSYDAGQTNEGAAFVYVGGSQDGRPVVAQQLQPTGSAAVEPWGDVPGAFRISLRGTHPEGRGRVKLESEWCPMGVPFGDPGCGTQRASVWRDVTATRAGVTLTDTIADLTPGVAYRWRARVLHAPFSVTQPGVAEPEVPAHGPWRRPTAQSVEADLRAAPEPEASLALWIAVGAVTGLRASRRR